MKDATPLTPLSRFFNAVTLDHAINNLIMTHSELTLEKGEVLRKHILHEDNNSLCLIKAVH